MFALVMGVAASFAGMIAYAIRERRWLDSHTRLDAWKDYARGLDGKLRVYERIAAAHGIDLQKLYHYSYGSSLPEEPRV